jgi:8-oxo-dGTP pyrophosphatase MutT (NUDIX family)
VRPVDNSVRDASTVMLVRDLPDLHVFLLRRSARVEFVPGATVFPGGALDADDASPEAQARVIGLDDAAASHELRRESGGLAFRVAAVRECFEESGILLARDATTGEQIGADARFDAWRERCNARTASFTDLLVTEDLVIDARDLRVFAHWITPMGAPRRYDTWFFVAESPDGHEGVHDDSELVDSGWVRPREALRAFARGAIDLILPTQRSLETLAMYTSTRALLDDVPPPGPRAHPSEAPCPT